MKTPKQLFSILLSLILLVNFSNCEEDEPTPTQFGQAIFWTASKTLGGSYIIITFDGSTMGSITVYSTTGTSPACGTSGYVTVNAGVGTYKWSGLGQNGAKWSGSITITANGCFKMQLTA